MKFEWTAVGGNPAPLAYTSWVKYKFGIFQVRITGIAEA